MSRMGVEGVVDVVDVVGAEDVVTGEDNNGVEGVVGVAVDEVIDAVGAAKADHQQAQCSRRGGTGRSGGAIAARRTRAGDFPT
jgi:hypothetical protein